MPRKDGTISEAEFTTQVIELLTLRGWKVAHIRPAKTARGWRTPYQGHIGLPDIIAARGQSVLLAELKVGRNKPTPEQQEWLTASGGVLWRPEDWDTIEDISRNGIHEQAGTDEGVE
jgi:hypothetical protein